VTPDTPLTWSPPRVPTHVTPSIDTTPKAPLLPRLEPPTSKRDHPLGAPVPITSAVLKDSHRATLCQGHRSHQTTCPPLPYVRSDLGIMPMIWRRAVIGGGEMPGTSGTSQVAHSLVRPSLPQIAPGNRDSRPPRPTSGNRTPGDSGTGRCITGRGWTWVLRAGPTGCMPMPTHHNSKRGTSQPEPSSASRRGKKPLESPRRRCLKLIDNGKPRLELSTILLPGMPGDH